MSQEVSRADIVDPFPADRDGKIDILYRYWRSIKTGAALPGRKDFDPTMVPSLLPNIWLIDVIPPTGRFRYRLIGTAIAEARGKDQTGCYLDDEVVDFPHSQTSTDLKKVLAGEVSWRKGRPNPMHRLSDIISLERIFLPLAADGSTVDIVLALTIYRTALR